MICVSYFLVQVTTFLEIEHINVLTYLIDLSDFFIGVMERLIRRAKGVAVEMRVFGKLCVLLCIVIGSLISH